MKRIWFASIGFIVLFAVLLAVRMDIPALLFSGEHTDHIAPGTLPETDTWKNLYLNDRKSVTPIPCLQNRIPATGLTKPFSC